MHFGMAVQASLGEQKFGLRIGRSLACDLRQAGMADGGVAGLAKLRRAAHKQSRLVGAVLQGMASSQSAQLTSSSFNTPSSLGRKKKAGQG